MLGAGSWELGTISYLPALLSPRDLGVQALWAWQVDGGQDGLSSVPKGTLHSPQVVSSLSQHLEQLAFSCFPSSGGLSLPSCQDLIFPVTPSSGPRKCQPASWEHGPPAGEQAARCSFVFAAALPISLYSAHMPRAKREEGQARTKLDNGLPER